MGYKYPVYQPYLNGKEKQYVCECIDSTWISSKGKFIGDFELAFAHYTGSKHAISVSNGTVALHLALVSLGIGPGDEVIVPSLTYIASVNPIVYCGATPVFADSCADTWQIDPKEINKKITSKTKAIILVHLYGQACEIDSIKQIADDNGLFLIEDCAEAIGTKYKNKHVGIFGDIAIFSFFGNKTITTGEGGMVTTNDNTLNDRARHYKFQGLAMYREYWHDVIGYNYRMTNICAAIGLAQLEKIDFILERKRKIAEWYKYFLSNEQIDFQYEAKNTSHSYWMVTILVKRAEDRDKLRNHLKNNGIETRPSFFPVHTMPIYSMRYQKLPIAENLGWRGINLPSYPELDQDNVKEICTHINGYFNT